MTIDRPRSPREIAATAAVWLALVTALVASYSHVARALHALEPDGASWPAYLGAAGIDAGLVALVATTAVLAARGRRRGRFLAAVGVFVAISAAANADAALGALLGGRVLWSALPGLDALDAARAVVFAAALPLLVLVLASAAEALAESDPAAAPEPDAATDYHRAPRVPASPLPAPTAALVAWGAGEGQREGLDGHNDQRQLDADALRDRFAALAIERPDASRAELAAMLDRGRTWGATTARRLIEAGRLIERDGRWLAPDAELPDGGAA